MSLHSRLRALERERPSEECPECGWTANPSPADVVIRMRPIEVFQRYTPTLAIEQPGDRCAVCGRLVVIRLASPNALPSPQD